MGMHKDTKTYLSLAAGCWMLGEGARMVTMGLFYPEHVYRPNTFDLLFDWAPLTLLGLLFMGMSIRSFHANRAARDAYADKGNDSHKGNERKAKPLN